MLGCFNPILGKIWTNPAIGLKKAFKKEFNGWVCPYLTQNWVKTTQHFFRVLPCLVETVIHFFFIFYFFMNRKLNGEHLFEIEHCLFVFF